MFGRRALRSYVAARRSRREADATADVRAWRKELPVGAAVAVLVAVVVAGSSTWPGARSSTPAPRRQLATPSTVVADQAATGDASVQALVDAGQARSSIPQRWYVPTRRLYVNPDSHAADQVRQWDAE